MMLVTIASPTPEIVITTRLKRWDKNFSRPSTSAGAREHALHILQHRVQRGTFLDDAIFHRRPTLCAEGPLHNAFVDWNGCSEAVEVRIVCNSDPFNQH